MNCALRPPLGVQQDELILLQPVEVKRRSRPSGLYKVFNFETIGLYRNEKRKKPVEKPHIEFNTVDYRVQFTTSTKKIPVTDKRFSSIPEVSVYYHNGLYKYTSGHFKTIDEAVKHQINLEHMGYKTAWVVKMKGNKKLVLSYYFF